MVLNAFRHQRKEHTELDRDSVVGRVLNAFRHQRKEHWLTCRQRWPHETLVLNAFRHQRKEHHRHAGSYRRVPNCAQRLSASTEGTLGYLVSAARASPVVLNAFRHQRKEHHRAMDRRTWLDVLNAFRHQRKEHPVSRCRRWIAVDVLNAFRHQRKEHGLTAVDRSAGVRMCSTPFGINGRNTSCSHACDLAA